MSKLVADDGGGGGYRVRRAGSVALVALLVVSVFTGAWLARLALRYVDAATAVRLDPAGAKVYGGQPAPPADDRPLLVLFGDSRAAMWADPSPPGYRVLNRGIGYQTTAQILLRIDADVSALHPAVVVLEAGVNDLKAIANFPERRAEIVADCKANLRTIVDRCRQAGATVVLVTVFDIGDVPLWRRPFWSREIPAAVSEVNAFLPQLAGDKVLLFDANPVLDGGPGVIRHEYQADHLHLLPAGYTALNGRLVPLVSSLRR